MNGSALEPATTTSALAVDPFSDAVLRNPYAFHQELREAAPVVRLESLGVWALGRYAEVSGTLNNWETFCSSAGVGLSDFTKEKPWRQPSLLIEADPPLHTRTRGVITSVLSRRALNALRASFQAEVERLADELVERGRFDAIQDLAQAFPLKVFPDAVGLETEGRENLLLYADMVFNAFGPRNALFEASTRRAAPVVAYITEHCRREKLRPDGLGAQIHAFADSGQVTSEEAMLLVRSLLTAGVDTTVNGIGNALLSFVRHPDQWKLLTGEPQLARAAFEEALRYESPVQTFFRTTTQPVVVGAVQLGVSEKILMYLGAANRDRRRWPDPDRFDIRRTASGHVAFGSGIHACVGQMIARLEGELVLTALAKRVALIEPDGEPVQRLNNTLRGWQSLPVRVRPK
jgi:4-methoxybenzoate monooxygenase (O-demethylating)